jgi:hypothetical protein
MSKGSVRKLNIAEIEYMTKYQEVKSMKEIAADLDRSYEFVRVHMKDIPKNNSKNNYKRDMDSAGIITKTDAGKSGVAVMTQLGSNIGDRDRKNKEKVLGPKNAIRKIKE